MIPAVPDFGFGPAPEPGRVDEVAPGVHRLTAPNPGLVTGPGTNTYLVGHTDPVVVDPGPADESHTAAIVAAAAPLGLVRAILVTHTHVDHAPGAAALAATTGARVVGYGPAEAFRPDECVGEGWTLACPGPAPMTPSRCGPCTRPATPRTICAGWSRSRRCSSRATTSCTVRRS